MKYLNDLESFLEADGSSPSRGTWIEISRLALLHSGLHVVPLTGDVD